jgi:HK97 gp10 family phage protein
MYKSNFDEGKKRIAEGFPRALHAIGIFWVGETQVRCPVGVYPEGSGRVGGNLRGSYGYQVNEQESSVTNGSPVDYAPHVELGTYKMKAQPHLKPAVEQNIARIENIVKENLNVG